MLHAQMALIGLVEQKIVDKLLDCNFVVAIEPHS